ncbi:MBL fold metallo-hydrolase [Collibacillus ludicampi]|uniref:MBL fold metallo-hydrolase n=1 Tax=Collibacillus ludicampi TaxID=2771369 RepID=A0AAV4LDK9_9BACL|nr:N-acyl homoserine lactonase family protein [Collibacillus ludicampi]GIM45522.1 MBL fold metallo-hydrolase [Collibacillus ludicampi]
MITTWKVMALKMGELSVEKSSLTYGRDVGKAITIPVWATAIFGDGYKILVDTGIHDKTWVEEHVCPCNLDSDEYIVEAIKQGLGWNPEDVNIVINTHLHYDHCGNNRLFKKARFIVQENEWKAAFNPIPSQQDIYLRELFDDHSVDYFSWKFVNDEAEILPGLKVFLTPGHSEGHQSVLVKTEEGTLCISGDVSNLLENIRENIPAGILTSTKEIYESMNKVRRLAQRILPGHEISIRKYQESNFPMIEKV